MPRGVPNTPKTKPVASTAPTKPAAGVAAPPATMAAPPLVRRHTESEDYQPGQGQSIGMDEHGHLDAPSAIQVDPNMIRTDQLDMEAFMNEIVKIRITESNREGDLKVVPLTVNDRTHPVMRGRETPVRRMFVECLARAKETTYQDALENPMDPSSIVRVPATALSYPFTVIEDSQRGRKWLEKILAETH